ncbi:MAG: Hsp20/alpha crystallin family protein [Haloferacaceae archaeon]
MTTQTNPFEELERLVERMQANFEETARWWESERAPADRPETAGVQIDLEDTDDELVLTADLPGFEKDDIDVRVTDHSLRLTAERESEETEEGEEAGGKYIRRERHRKSVGRSIPLPQSVERDGIDATYRNGVLTVRMPKAETIEEGTPIAID